MRRPSARILSNTATLYRFTATQDGDAGIASDPYVLLASGVACSVQPADPERTFDATGKVVEIRAYSVVFAIDYALVANDKITWVDASGTARDLFVMGQADQAGRGSCFIVGALERT